MKNVAKQYQQFGLCPLPASKNTKFVTIGGWKEYQCRLPTDEEIESWPWRGLCIICGDVSGNFLAIDFDQHGKAFCDWKTKIPDDLFRRLVVVKTQSNGFHVYVRSESKVDGSKKLAATLDKKTLIETKANGGLVIAPPTDGYAIVQGAFDSIPVLSETEIKLLLESARSFDESGLPQPNRFILKPVEHSGCTKCLDVVNCSKFRQEKDFDDGRLSTDNRTHRFAPSVA